MCGIVGLLSFDGSAVDGPALQRLNDAMRHRGPDDEGYFVRDGVGLAMRRLSIIDLADGHQPMATPDGRYVIVFNGEVYNYRELRASLEASGTTFRTQSDTEVVLVGYARWGTAVLDRMVGMWGLAIYDTLERSLFLARDRLGKKQIYYALTPRYLVFASEMGVVMRQAPELRVLNPASIPEFLRHGYIGPGVQAVDRVHLLPAGCWAKVDAAGRMVTHEYWNLHTPSSLPPPANEHEAAERAYSLIVQAVRRRLVADVPVTVMLSSGLDSSTLAHVLTKELNAPLQAFTLGFDNVEFDESRDAGEFAREMGLPWHREHVSGTQVAADFHHIIDHSSSLQANTAQVLYFYVNRMIHAAGYKVTLNGNGGDELFAGYPTYRATRLFQYYRHVPAVLRRRVHSAAKLAPPSLGRVSFEYQLKKFTEVGETSTAVSHGYWRTMFSPTELRATLRREHFPDLDSHTALYERVFSSNADCSAENPRIVDLLKADMIAWLQPMLPWTDNMSMAHSVEMRLPMLDPDLVAFVYGLPDEYLFRGWNLKRLMKTMLRTRLPRALLTRRKRGTHVPISRWINGELAEIVNHYLSAESLQRLDLFDAMYVGELLASHREGKADHTFKLWNLVVLTAWAERYAVSLP